MTEQRAFAVPGAVCAPDRRSSSGDADRAQVRITKVSFRCPRIFRNPASAKSVARALESEPGVARVGVSVLTGRIAVLHDERSSLEILQRAAAHALEASGEERAVPIEIRLARCTGKLSEPPAAQANGPDKEVAGAGWHALDKETVLAKLRTSHKGLGAEEVRRRRDEFGTNALPEPVPPSDVRLFLDQFRSLPVFLLLGSATFSLTTRAVLESAVTIAVVVANAVIGYSTESSAQRAIQSMTCHAPWKVRVRRDGEIVEISSEEVVPGDLLILRAGTILPADARVIESDDLLVNESLLTGESEPVRKRVSAVDLDSVLSSRSSIVHRGTFVASGTGAAVAVSIAAETEIGRIEAASAKVRAPPTILEQDLGRLGTQLAIASGAICIGVFALGLLRRRPLAAMFRSSVALAVAAVPEGLPAIATTTLALELRRLRSKKVIVRRLHAVEGLGAVRTICFDKTGTLTENKMSVSVVALTGMSGSELIPMVGDSPEANGVRCALEIGALCSDVEIDVNENSLHGSATECAIVDLAFRKGIAASELRFDRPRVDARLRSAERRFMATLHAETEHDAYLVAVKGDPVSVLDRCDRVVKDGVVQFLDDGDRRMIREQIEGMASNALRVLGIAYTDTRSRAQWAEIPLIWAGALGLADPLRPGTREAVSALQGGGIRTVMITGDQSATARAIAAELNLACGQSLQIMDARDLSEMPEELLSALAKNTDVFARVSPTQKLSIVKALQAEGDVVAMTGDGYNDAPAMKAADIAIAIGANSAGAARDVADIVIAGEHIRHIADGISYGRTVQANVRKTMHFMFATNLSEILVILAETLNTADEIESPLELLWLNLVTDILPGFGLALEPPEADVMVRPPRNRGDGLLRAGDFRRSGFEAAIISAGALAAHAYGLAKHGPGPRTRGLTLFSLITGQLLHGFSCRSDKLNRMPLNSLFANRALNWAIGSSFALQLLPLCVPSIRRVLGIAPLGAADLAVAMTTGLASFAVNRALPAPEPPAQGEAPHIEEVAHA